MHLQLLNENVEYSNEFYKLLLLFIKIISGVMKVLYILLCQQNALIWLKKPIWI